MRTLGGCPAPWAVNPLLAVSNISSLNLLGEAGN
jgi:hypothetical protein